MAQLKPGFTFCTGGIVLERAKFSIHIVGIDSSFAAEAYSLLAGILSINKTSDVTMACDNKTVVQEVNDLLYYTGPILPNNSIPYWRLIAATAFVIKRRIGNTIITHVKGHTNNIDKLSLLNREADYLAKRARKRQQADIYLRLFPDCPSIIPHNINFKPRLRNFTLNKCIALRKAKAISEAVTVPLQRSLEGTLQGSQKCLTFMGR